jgi:hypothetical protein
MMESAKKTLDFNLLKAEDHVHDWDAPVSQAEVDQASHHNKAATYRLSTAGDIDHFLLCGHLHCQGSVGHWGRHCFFPCGCGSGGIKSFASIGIAGVLAIYEIIVSVFLLVGKLQHDGEMSAVDGWRILSAGPAAGLACCASGWDSPIF